jgi:hypothetical protein
MVFGISCGQEFYGAAPRAPYLLCFLQFWVVLDPYFEVDFSLFLEPCTLAEFMGHWWFAGRSLVVNCAEVIDTWNPAGDLSRRLTKTGPN